MTAWPASDRYDRNSDDLLSPASDGAAVAPSDSSPLPVPSKRLWVGAPGPSNVAVKTVRGASLIYINVPPGTYIEVRAAYVLATGTTATNIVAEY